MISNKQTNDVKSTGVPVNAMNAYRVNGQLSDFPALTQAKLAPVPTEQEV